MNIAYIKVVVMEVELKLRRLNTVGPPVKRLPTSSTEADNVDYL